MMWPEPELRAIIRPEPEMKNRSLHSTIRKLRCYMTYMTCFNSFPELITISSIYILLVNTVFV
jgi:hypothetical protein